jgi:tripartite-type tricarboxylate transporter receptor subunit TctC
MELMKSLARIDIVHIAYKGTGQALSSVITGEIQMVAISPPSALPLLQSGKVRALAVLRDKRISALPEVPTAAQAGLPGLEVNTWYGVLTRAGTAPPLIERLNSEINKALQAKDTRDRLEGVGVEPAGTTPQQFADFLKTETTRLGKLVRDSGAKAE